MNYATNGFTGYSTDGDCPNNTQYGAQQPYLVPAGYIGFPQTQLNSSGDAGQLNYAVPTRMLPQSGAGIISSEGPQSGQMSGQMSGSYQPLCYLAPGTNSPDTSGEPDSSGGSDYSFESAVCAALADSSTSETPPEGSGGRLRKRKSPQVQQRQRRAANERERRRMQSINKAFDRLRARIPTLPYEKRLSKVDTLRLAIGYIHLLHDLLESDDEMRAAGLNVEDEARRNVRGRGGNFGRLGPPPRKVVIECHQGFSMDDQHADMPPLRGHSLSWKNSLSECAASPHQQQYPSVLATKLWVPQLEHLPLANSQESQASENPDTTRSGDLLRDSEV